MFRLTPYLDPEVQGWIRHILHFIGMMLVGYAGITEDSLEMWVGAAISVFSITWFLGVTIYNHKKRKQRKNKKQCDCGTEYCECNNTEQYEDETNLQQVKGETV